MNKLYFSIIGMIIFCFLFGCNQENKPVMPLESVLSIPVNTVQVKSLVENNNYLYVDVDRLSQSICSRSGNSIDTTAMGKMRAALYRFYSRVKMADGKYVCDLKNAEEINISERLYEAILNNLNEMNTWIEQSKASGKEVMIQEVDEAYLNSLLE